MSFGPCFYQSLHLMWNTQGTWIWEQTSRARRNRLIGFRETILSTLKVLAVEVVNQWSVMVWLPFMGGKIDNLTQIPRCDSGDLVILLYYQERWIREWKKGKSKIYCREDAAVVFGRRGPDMTIYRTRYVILPTPNCHTAQEPWSSLSAIDPWANRTVALVIRAADGLGQRMKEERRSRPMPQLWVLSQALS